MSTSRASLSRHQNHGNTLVPAERAAMLHICVDCKDQILGFGSCYKCNKCNIYIHDACKKSLPDSLRNHPFISNFSLKFSDEELGGKVHCSACYSKIQGIMYTGCHANKMYYLHPNCIDLPQNLIRCVNNDNPRLQLYGDFPNSIECMFCKTNDKEGWSYCMTKNGMYKLGCHVRCMKDKIREDWLRERIPVEHSSREAYFEGLYKRDLNKITQMIGDLGLTAAALGVDLTTSAFVGAPFNTLLSIAVSLLTEVAKSRSGRT